jgi:hypothetical protein
MDVAESDCGVSLRSGGSDKNNESFRTVDIQAEISIRQFPNAEALQFKLPPWFHPVPSTVFPEGKGSCSMMLSTHLPVDHNFKM